MQCCFALIEQSCVIKEELQNSLKKILHTAVIMVFSAEWIPLVIILSLFSTVKVLVTT